jgi:hypothetical protein
MPEVVAELGKMLKKWVYDPPLFVEEAIGVNDKTRAGLRITSQQRQGLEAYGKLIEIKEKIARGGKLTEKELDLAEKVGVSVRGGRGPGKTTFKAWALIHFMSCLPYARVICTGANADVVKNNLFSEVNKWLNLQDKDGNYVCVVRDLLEVQERRIIFKGLPKDQIGKRWFAEIRTVHPQRMNQTDAETLGGAHEDYLLAIAVEASGTPDFVWTPIEAGFTGLCNIGILGWNPTRRKGFAYKSHFGETRGNWIRLHWDAEESELVTKESIERDARRGKDSNYYRIHVKGLPPTAETDTIIPYEFAEGAAHREIEPDMYDPIVGGLDCAMGGDEAVLIVRHGMKVIDIAVWPDIHDTEELGFRALQKLWEHGFDVCYVDNLGLGAGVYSYMKRHEPTKIQGVKVSEAAPRGDKFFRLRDQLWWKMRDVFERGLIQIPNDELLIDQIADPKIDSDEQYSGKLKVESKQKMRKRGRGSPDRADALMITFYRDDTFMKARKKERRSYRGKYSRKRRRRPELAGVTWMGR